MSDIRVTVVGTGVAGASTAFALAAAGARVTLVESGLPGQATAAGAGIVQPWSSSVDGPVYDLYAAGAAHYPRLVEQLTDAGVTDIGYRVSGSIVVDADPARLDAVERRVRERVRDVPLAGTVERVADGRALFPPLAPGLGALAIPGGARVDGRQLRRGLLAAAARHGASVEQGTARTQRVGESGYALRVGDRPVAADAVVLAAGAWTNRLLEPLGHRIEVEPQRGQIAQLRLECPDTAAWPSVLPLAGHYLVCFEGGRIAAGATRETGSGFDPRPTAAGVLEVLSHALSVAPGLATATLLETRVGLRPLALGRPPVLGAVPGYPGLYVDAGFGAAGLTMGPVAGAALAQLVLTGSSELDLGPFAV